MTALTLVLVGGLMTGGDTLQERGLYAEAIGALQTGNPALARERATKLVARNGGKPGYHVILGDAYVAGGDLPDAIRAYERSSELQGGRDPEALKKLAVVQEWTRQYASAAQSLRRSLELNPGDDNARSSLRAIGTLRSLHVFASAGGGEIDNARNVQELGGFVGWVDWLDLYGGVSRTDRTFYRRTNRWADAYIFPDYRLYLRIGFRSKSYEYPATINPNPDNSAYHQATHIQVELGYTYGIENTLSLEVEYFRPTFFWNRDLTAGNVKVGASIRATIAGHVYGRLFASVLRNPDPDTFVMDAASHAALSFGYETVSLIGAGVGYDDGRFSAEVKYVPDRDLDRSLQWSVFARARYMSGQFGVQGDLLIDRYPETQGRTISTSRVAMLTVIAEPWQFLDMRAGVKALTTLTTEFSPFLSLRVKTGI